MSKTSVNNSRNAGALASYSQRLSAEFGRAGQLGSRIKNAFVFYARAIGGNHLVARLVSPLIKLIRSDIRHAAGERSADYGDMHHLEGFEFNEIHQPPGLSDVPCSLLRSAKNDQVLVKTAPFTADAFLTGQVVRATHFKVGLLVAAIPLGMQGCNRLFKNVADSRVIACKAIPSLQVLVDLAISETPILYCVALWVSFFRFAGSLSVPYMEGKKDLLRIVKAFCA